MRNYRSSPRSWSSRTACSPRRAGRSAWWRRAATARCPDLDASPTAEQELAALVAWIRARLGEGIAPAEIAVLVRMNAQLPPIEAALTRAGIAFQVRGQRFFERPEVRDALAGLRRPRLEPSVPAPRRRHPGPLAEAVGSRRTRLAEGDEARERQAVARDAARRSSTGSPPRTRPPMPRAVIADLEARAAHEREGAAGGVNLLTYHRAKGLEWDAVFLPSLEEGTLPIRQAGGRRGARRGARLLYVGHHPRPACTSPCPGRSGARAGVARLAASRAASCSTCVRARGTMVTQLAGPPARGAACGGAATRTTRCSTPSAPGAPRARQEAMPPYVIAHDATLSAIAEERHARWPPCDASRAWARPAREVRRRDPRGDRGGPRGVSLAPRPEPRAPA